MPRDAVSRTANVERTGRHKWVKDNMTKQARISYYYSLLFPYISYNIIVWGRIYNKSFVSYYSTTKTYNKTYYSC